MKVGCRISGPSSASQDHSSELPTRKHGDGRGTLSKNFLGTYTDGCLGFCFCFAFSPCALWITEPGGLLSWIGWLLRAKCSTRVSNKGESILRVLVPSAAVRCYHEWSSLKQHKFIIMISSGGQKSRSSSAGYSQGAGGFATFLDALRRNRLKGAREELRAAVRL